MKKIFVTGATGHVGSAVVQELLQSGYEVVALARSDANEEKLKELGVKIHRGSLEDPASLRAAAAACDGVIHCAFNHDFSKFVENSQAETKAIEALGEALIGTNRPLIVTSSVALLSLGEALLGTNRPVTEDYVRDENFPIPRDPETVTFSFVPKGVRAMVVRLPPTVHAKGDPGVVPQVINSATKQGASAYIGEGLNRWPAVHRLDSAVIYRLALEKGVAGSRYHAIAEEGIPFKEIARTISEKLHLPLVSKPVEEAEQHFGFFGSFAKLDCPASSEKTRASLGWEPKHPGLIRDMEENYF